jgi:hypothetical protein
VKRPPTPINIQVISETTEGMAYSGAGFPLVGMLHKLNDNKGNPSLTITRGLIAALRRDEHRHLDLVQVDGALEPGNFGGPIVEEKTGRLIGVAVAKLGSVATIGFVVPAEQLRKTLAGRIGALDVTLKALEKNNADLEVKAEVVDPKGVVKAVMVHAAPASAGTIVPHADGSWPPLLKTEGIELQHDPKTASASGRVQVALSGRGAAARKLLIQTGHKNVGGQIVYSRPKELDLPAKPGPILSPSQRRRLINAARRKSYLMLGQLVDPDKDCKLLKDDDRMKVTIEIPGNRPRTLAPSIVTPVDKKKPLHNAPMSLIEVEGDFAALVEVTGEMSPGSILPADLQGNRIPFTFQGAGLVVYQDKDNFVRLERTAGVAVETLQPIHKLLFEVVKDGKFMANQSYPPVPEGPVHLLLMRRNGKVMCGATFNPGSPPQPFNTVELDFPAKVKIGLSASNISAKAFTATFDNFALLTESTVVDAMFGSDKK